MSPEHADVFARLTSIDHRLAGGAEVLAEFDAALRGPRALSPEAAWAHPAGVPPTRGHLARVALPIAGAPTWN